MYDQATIATNDAKQSSMVSREEHNEKQAELFTDAVARLSNIPKPVLQASALRVQWLYWQTLLALLAS